MECGECGEDVAADDVACRACGAHQWRRRITQPTRRTTAVHERPARRRDDDSPTGWRGLRARWWPEIPGGSAGSGTTRPSNDRGPSRSSAVHRPSDDRSADPRPARTTPTAAGPPPRTDTSMLRGGAARRSARSAQQRRSTATAVVVTVVAPLCIGLGVVAFGESLTRRSSEPSGPVWVLVFESVPTSRVAPEEFARTYRGADVDIVDGGEHPGLRPGYYSAITHQTYASRRQAAADCGSYGRTEGAQCRPVQLG